MAGKRKLASKEEDTHSNKIRRTSMEALPLQRRSTRARRTQTTAEEQNRPDEPTVPTHNIELHVPKSKKPKSKSPSPGPRVKQPRIIVDPIPKRRAGRPKGKAKKHQSYIADYVPLCGPGPFLEQPSSVAERAAADRLDQTLPQGEASFAQDNQWRPPSEGEFDELDNFLEQGQRWLRIKMEVRNLMEITRDIGYQIASPQFKLARKLIKECLAWYARASNAVSAEAASDGRVPESLEALYDLLDSIEDLPPGIQGTSLARDFYGPGITALVKLLGAAFEFNKDMLMTPNETGALQDIICLLDVVVTLCERLIWAGARPASQMHPMKPTSAVIWPRLRDIREAFRKELGRRYDQRNGRLLRRYERERYARRQEAEAEQLEQLQKEAARLRQQLDLDGTRSSEEELDDQLEDGYVVATTGRGGLLQRTDHSSAIIEWSEAMDDQLLKGLAVNGRFPVGQRYVACLTARLLQNLHPKHIQSRAMELKPTLISFYEENGGVPEWVDSIRTGFTVET